MHRLTVSYLEPVVHTNPQGVCYIQTGISINDYIWRRALCQDLFEGPLTDYESDDKGGKDSSTVSDDSSSKHSGSKHSGSIAIPGNSHPSASALPVSQTTALPSTGICSPLLPHSQHESNSPISKPTSAQPQLEPPKESRKERKKRQSHQRRRLDRSERQEEEGSDEKQVTKKRQLEAVKDVIQVDFSLLEDAPTSGSGYVGKRAEGLPKENFTLSYCIQEGMTHFPWDGREGYIIGVLLGRPKADDSWEATHDQAYKALKQASRYFMARKVTTHRRGCFPSIAYGISYGGGQTEPQHIRHSKQTDEVLRQLVMNPSIQQLGGFKSYGRQSYEYMKSMVYKLRASLPGLKRPYDDLLGVYPCRSFNLGKHTASFPHTDTVNMTNSWCSVTPIGEFDSKLGGHMVLSDLSLVVDFPKGSTILIPSALLTHSNTTLQPGDTRFSIVQYAAGGLFRWVENGGMSDKEWMKKATEEDINRRQQDNKERQSQGLMIFTKLTDFISYLKPQ